MRPTDSAGRSARSVSGGSANDAATVLFAANYFDAIKMQDQHMAERMSEHTNILYVDPPMSRLTPRHHPHLQSALDGPRLRKLSPSLARLTPVVTPFPERPGIAAWTRRSVRRVTNEALRDLGWHADAVVSARALGPRLSAMNARRRVFWAQDDLAGGAELLGMSARRIGSGEDRLARDADLIIAGTPGVAELWRARGFDPALVPYGCDAQQYADTDSAPWPHDVTLPSPIVGFIGHLAERIDVAILDAVAARGHSLLFVGPRQPKFAVDRLGAILARPNVLWVGPKKFHELTPYLKAIDVGIVPYNDSAFNRGSFPLKTLEYLAAGRGAVATPLPATLWLDSPLIDVAAEPAAFADAVDHALQVPRTPELVRQRQAFAAAHGWDVRAVAFLEAIASTTSDRSVASVRI
jgi:teichuronic acid biosynthesis glycosyltransferase TuaH